MSSCTIGDVCVLGFNAMSWTLSDLGGSVEVIFSKVHCSSDASSQNYCSSEFVLQEPGQGSLK